MTLPMLCSTSRCVASCTSQCAWRQIPPKTLRVPYFVRQSVSFSPRPSHVCWNQGILLVYSLSILWTIQSTQDTPRQRIKQKNENSLTCRWWLIQVPKAQNTNNNYNFVNTFNKQSMVIIIIITYTIVLILNCVGL